MAANNLMICELQQKIIFHEGLSFPECSFICAYFGVAYTNRKAVTKAEYD